MKISIANNEMVFAGNLVQRHALPFRLTPSLLTFITPYRKHQFINCLNATNQCLNNSIEDISSVLKLLLRDELNRSYNIVSNDLQSKL